MKKHNLQVEVVRQVYRNEESGWSIYAVSPVDEDHGLKLNSYRNITIKGKTRPLTKGEIYNVSIYGPVSDPKYGDGFELQWVEPEKLDTIHKQDSYLQSILTEKQFHSLKEAYPDGMLLDMVMMDQIDVDKLNGIKEKTLIKIKEKLNQNSHISVLVSYLTDLELSIKKVEKIMEHFGSPDVAVSAIKNNIYILCDIRTFGFKVVDKIAMDRGDSPANFNRVKSCLEYLLEEDTFQGHTWSYKNEVMEKAEGLLQINPSIIENHLNNMKNIESMNGRLYLKHILEQEARIAAELKRISESYVTVDNLAEKTQYRIHIVEEAQGFTFTEEQRDAIENGMKHGVSIVNGRSGVGKSTLVKGLIDTLGTDNYMTCGLSGKSAQVLSQRGIKSSTIHRMLGYNQGQFTFNEEMPLNYDVVVVDEISMVNVGLLLSVLRAIPNGCKLILVGDSGQLPAIGYGDVLRDLLQTERYPVFLLTKVHRQAAKSGILSLGNTIRDGHQITQYGGSGKEVYGELKDQVMVSLPSTQKESIPEMVVNIAKDYKNKIKTYDDLFDLQIIVANKERGELSVRKLNQRLQAIFNDPNKPFLLRNGYGFRVGDKVITQGNSYGKRFYQSIEDYKEWYTKDRKADMDARELVDVEEEELEEYNDRKNKTDVFNGTMGYVYHIDVARKVALIKYESSDYLFAYTQEEMERIDMAYAITVHKSQGSGFKDLVFAIDYGAYTLLNRQLVYTAITRASRKGVLICENDAMYQAIKTDASGIRRTTLGEIFEMEKESMTDGERI